MDYGAISLVPTALVLILAIWSHRTLESVIAGAIVAFLIMDGWQFADRLATVTTEVLADEVTAWVVLVCALYGSFIASRYAEDRTGQNLTVRNVGMGQFSMPLVSRPCNARNLCSRGTHRHLIQK